MMRSTFGRLFNKNWVLAATMICGASVFASCSHDDNEVVVNFDPTEIQKQWYCETPTDEDDPVYEDEYYNRQVFVYEFFKDGTGYFEFYDLNDDKVVLSFSTRNYEGSFHYTISGNTITIKFDAEGTGGWKLTYADGKLTDMFPHTYAPSTPEQQAQTLKWCEEWDILNGDDVIE